MPLGDHLLTVARRTSPMFADTLGRYGDRPLREFLATVEARRGPALQSLDDLCAAVREEAAAFGPEVAATVAADLHADPIVPTSNHYGIETVSESVQSTVLFSLRPGARSRHVLVLGFGSVSMNNWSYPMGLRLYDGTPGQSARLPQRLPVFPNRLKRRTVCAAGPFDQEMVQRARQRVERMGRSDEVSQFAVRAVTEVLDDVLADADTLALPSYRAQSPVVNAALWRRMFRHPWLGGDVVQLQIERVCALLLRRDLHDPGSLVHRLFFDEDVRQRLVDTLDGERACWRRAALERAVRDGTSGSAATGTMFFWGLNPSGYRVPLTLVDDSGGTVLAGVDERGEPWRVPFSGDGILDGLDAGHLLPSLFTCFALTALARGLTCVGGYYQAEYLPAMKDAVVGSLASSGRHTGAADVVAAAPAGIRLAGMQGLVREIDGGGVIPAGPVELSGMGGVDEPELEALMDMPVRDACLVAFTELFDILFPGADLPDDWVLRLARENAEGMRVRRHRVLPTPVGAQGRVKATTSKEA